MNLDPLLYWLIVGCGTVVALVVPVWAWLSVRGLGKIHTAVHEQEDTLTSFFRVCREHFEKYSRNHFQIVSQEREHHDTSLEKLNEISSKLANYANLAVDIRDFYTALNHFNEAMDKGQTFRRDMAASFEGFQTTVDRSKEAVRDFIDLVGFLKEGQEKTLFVLRQMQAVIADQNENLKRITGQLELDVTVSGTKELSESLGKLNCSLTDQSELLKQLIALGEKDKSWFRKIGEALLGK